MDFPQLIVQLLSGLTNGMILFIVASGLSLVFGVLRVINFAHGSIYMLGAFMAYSVFSTFAAKAFYFPLMLLLAPLGVALVGLVLEVAFFRPVYRKEHLLQLLLTYALVLIIDDLIRWTWGGAYFTVSVPPLFSGALRILGKPFPVYNLFLLLIGPVIALSLWFLLYRAKAGRLIRAAVADPEMLGALGVNVKRVFTSVFVLGAWLAGLGGALVAPLGSISLGMDMDIIIECFAVVVIGGLGSFPGALLGALILGVLHSFGILFLPRAAMGTSFLAMAIVLIIRPWGLFGKPERI